jgi:Putative phage tail protein
LDTDRASGEVCADRGKGDSHARKLTIRRPQQSCICRVERNSDISEFNTSITGTGAYMGPTTFNPNVTPIYNLADDDFIHEDGKDPLEVVRSDPYASYNWQRLQINWAGGYYNAMPIDAWDQNAMGDRHRWVYPCDGRSRRRHSVGFASHDCSVHETQKFLSLVHEPQKRGTPS